jgi:hypothetical protein
MRVGQRPNPVELELHNESSYLEEDLKTGVMVTNVSNKKPVKRRTTFSISPEHMAAAQNPLIDGKDYMDKVFKGKISFPPVKKVKVAHVEDDKKRLAAVAPAMPTDGVMMVKSGMDQFASVFLPQEHKTSHVLSLNVPYSNYLQYL